MPPKKKPKTYKPLPPGRILSDLRKKQWRLGSLIGQGGFGYLYTGSDKPGKAVKENAEYVIKVEPFSNGPLFVELAFYQRAAKEATIQNWMESKKLSHLGVPRYIASGSFENAGTKYRFMIIDRFGKDLEKLYLQSKKKFSLPTVFTLGLRIVEILEYLHEQEYVHADIKSSNIVTGLGKSNSKVYLLDYGLAYRYCPYGKHVAHKEDANRKHDGTVEYTSRDAHKGLAPSRRGDMEILAYCMLQWICGVLPWEKKLSDKDYVWKEKIRFMKNISTSLQQCLGASKVPKELETYFRYVAQLEYAAKPDYEKVKSMFKAALANTGSTDDGKSVLFAPSVSKVSKSSSEDSGANSNVRKRKQKTIQESDDEENPLPTTATRGSSAKFAKLDEVPNQESPGRNVQESPGRNFQESPGRNVQGSPAGIVQGSPLGIAQGFPGGYVQGSSGMYLPASQAGHFQGYLVGNVQAYPGGYVQGSLMANVVQSPVANYQGALGVNYQEIPRGCYQELPRGSYQESPRGSYQESPRGSSQESPRGSHQESQEDIPVLRRSLRNSSTSLRSPSTTAMMPPERPATRFQPRRPSCTRRDFAQSP